MKTLSLFILAAVSLNCIPAAALPPPCDDSAKIYKVCSSQRKLYAEALTGAAKEKKLLLVEFGFEACPWCVSMYKILHSPGNKEKTAAYHLIQIETGNSKLDGRKVLAALRKKEPGTKLEGFPFLALVNPVSGKTILLNTGGMEKNTASSKGHDPEKIFAALGKAAGKIR